MDKPRTEEEKKVKRLKVRDPRMKRGVGPRGGRGKSKTRDHGGSLKSETEQEEHQSKWRG